MFLLNNSDITILATVCVVNLFCAGVVRRAVLFNSGFMQRRTLFEGLSLFGFLGAISLSLFSILIWVSSPLLVIISTSLWVSLCLLVVVRIWLGHRDRLSSKVLEIPEFWNDESISDDQTFIMMNKKAANSVTAMSGPTELAINTSTLPLHMAQTPGESGVDSHATLAESSDNDVREI